MNTYLSSMVKELVMYVYISGLGLWGLLMFTFCWSMMMELVRYTYLSSMLKDLVMFLGDAVSYVYITLVYGFRSLLCIHITSLG